ncbi:hypothetical protein Acr_01g0009530 [Actinidia rufa]|uniref:Uncharacterized protein n=1 Tax=Actinidia rufa TaxID=165716 RepID=A0A7J0E3R6_9ERIC|nr:hypothetical protein Acr_01g0009530 [Actinidia rufa]
MVLVRALRAPRDLTERGRELVSCESKTGKDASERDYSSGTYERVSEERSKKRPEKKSQEEVKRRGQRRGLKKEVTEVKKRGRENVKEEIPAYDSGGQNPKRNSEDGDKEELYSYKRSDAELSLFRSRLVAVIYLVVHTREERWSHDDLQSDVLCSAPQLRVVEHLSEKVQTLQYGSAFTSVGSEVALLMRARIKREKQLTEAVKDGCRGVQDGGHLSSLKSHMVGMYELMAELIFSSLWLIN